VFLCALFWLSACLPALAVAPQRLLLEPPETVIDGGTVRLALSLTVDDEDGLRDLLKDGAILRLKTTVAVSRERSWWSDAEIVSREYDSILRHDPLTRDFVVTVGAPDEEKTLKDKNLTRLLHASWRRLSFPVAPLRLFAAQESAGEFLISVTLSLQHTDVPPWLEKNFIFWSADVVPRQTCTLPFRPPAGTD
jgi:hypothetical protein